MASAVEPPHKRARTEGEITPSPCGLPEEIWGNILSRLLPGPDVFKVRRVCHTFQRLTLPAILEYLSRQETMKADDFTQFHLPLFYLLIYQNSAFKVKKIVILMFLKQSYMISGEIFLFLIFFLMRCKLVRVLKNLIYGILAIRL